MGVWRKTTLALAAFALAGPHAAHGGTAKSLGLQEDICAGATAEAERAAPVPRHLLRAISLAETGRWDDDAKASFAWPWTVTSGGEGRYYATKAEAVNEVRKLAAGGVRNVDVGCMQVNLLYHAEAFASLEEAFDPVRNARYAARFLADLYAATGSWSDAAGRYHSSDPDRGEAYKLKVLRLWSGVRAAAGGEAVAGALPPAAAAPARTVAPPARIDRARMGELAVAFKTERAARRAAERAETAHRQLDAWRTRRIAGMSYAHLATVRRAEAAFEDAERLKARLGAAGARATLTDAAFAPN